MSMFSKLKTVKSTPFSDFIRHASSSKKKRVYSDVMKKATDRQVQILKKAKTAK